MRIGLDVRFLAQPGSGVYRYITHLLHWLPRVAPEHDYFLYGHAGVPMPAASAALQHRFIGGPRSLYSFAPQLWWMLLKDGLDLFHATAYTLPLTTPCATVLTLHDLTVEIHPRRYPGWKGRLFRAYIRRSALRADGVAADSTATRQDILRYYRLPPNKVRTIHLGGAGPEFSAQDRQAARAEVTRQTGREGPFLLYAGAVHERKNLTALIEAYGLARQRSAFAHRLLLIGRGSARQLAALDEHIERLGLTAHVQRWPPVPEEQLPVFYSAAAALIYPSLYEGFGLPVLEAMAAGTPVITSHLSSLAEVAGQAALLVNPTDTVAMGQAIARVLTDADLQKDLAARGLERAREFSWETCARQTAALYQAALGATQAGVK